MAITSFVRLPSASGSTNATSAVVGPVLAVTISCLNAAASARYLKIYDKATAPTVGTDAPFMTLALAPGNFFLCFDDGFSLTKGLAFALTTGAADNDTGAVTAADIVGLNIGIA